jgi:hypothetical protein
MSSSTRILTCGLLAVLMAGCVDADVANPNDPDRERTYPTPSDVESLIAGSFRTWWNSDQQWYSAGMQLSAMADELTSGWSYVTAFSQEPRQAIPNDPSHGLAYVVEEPWYTSYAAITATRDGLILIAGPDDDLFTDDDMEIGLQGEDTPRAIAFARFVMGLAHGTLGMLYDKAFVVDETTDLAAAGFADVKPYDEVVDAAVGYLQQASDIASEHTFVLPPAWVGTAVVDNERLVRLAHAYTARFLAYAARDPGERAAVDWNAVLSHAEQGITEDFYVVADDEDWWSDFKYWGALPSFARTDLRTLGPAGSTAESNQRWRDWETAPSSQVAPFAIDTDDARLPAYPPEEVDYWECVGVTERTASCGLYFEYRGRWSGRELPGRYHDSGYADYRNHDYLTSRIGPMVHVNLAEMDLLEAEALIRLGRDAEALPLINGTREGNGGLPPVTASGAPELDGRCTPRTLDGECGDLFEALKHEKRMEVYLTGMGVAYYDDRGWGDLLTGTAIHFPIPAQELMVLQQEIYTFGGGGPGSAPDIVRWSFARGVPGPDESCLEGQ